jgi:aminopeptidase-like protein
MIDDSGKRMHELAERLYPLYRSITGDGLRESLRIISEQIPIVIKAVPSGTKVFDWLVPQEWKVREAWIRDSLGNDVVNFNDHNLHLVSYSRPVRQRMALPDLRPHLHANPKMPDAIPYRTGYYNEDWGFCLTQNALDQLDDGEYDVCVDTELFHGELNYGELLIPGIGDEEVLISCHCCHPSMANDNLSGMVVATELALRLLNQPLRYSYRFLFVPGTIGSIAWLASNEPLMPRVACGLVLACVGDPGPLTYKRTKRKNTLIDRAVESVFRSSCTGATIREFMPYGYDERQYGSPGINLPVGCLSRSTYGSFPEYHTSADDLTFITSEALQDTLEKLERVMFIVDQNTRHLNLKPMAEPMLGKYGLYETTGGAKSDGFYELALLWVLGYSDGSNDLLAISEISGIDFDVILQAVHRLTEVGLLSELSE